MAFLMETIPHPTSTSENAISLLLAGEPMSVDKDEGPMKTRQDFLDDLTISRAPEDVRNENKPTASSTSEEIAAWRTRVLHHKKTRHRYVFQQWPRDPNGPIIKPENSELGKMAPNGLQLWAATLFDFYTVRRIPSVPNLMTFSSGSKLARWMKERGETYAQDYVDRQEEEEDPKLIFPCDIGRLIQDQEMMTRNKTWIKDVGKGKKKEREFWELPEPWPPASPFDLSAYPIPWPKKPFMNDFMTFIPTLQQYIPQSLLPPKLVVHDPWKLLKAEEYLDREKKVRETFIAEPHSKNEPPSGYMVASDQGPSQPGPCKPPIYIVLPFLPNREKMLEAHLYIAPVSKIGEGNHSFVYNAELELPRNQLVEEETCHQCVFEDMYAILREQDGEDGERRDPRWDVKSGKYVIKTMHKPEDVTTMPNLETGKDEMYTLRERVFSQELKYEGPFRVIESRVMYQDLSKRPYCKHVEKDMIHPLTSKVHVAAKLSIEGDVHLAREAENYQEFPRHFFEHWSGFNIVDPLHDPTPVGPVVPQFYGYYVIDQYEETKLREEREAKRKERKEEDEKKDEKPENEPEEVKEYAMEIDKIDAKKVENEPQEKTKKTDVETDKKKASEERSGKDHPEEQDEQDEEERDQYLSFILLLENCGSSIKPGELSVDDASESGSLVLRFNKEGWVHGSIAKRNILRQPGPLSAWPIQLMSNAMARGGLGKDWSFRLIDFGRSYKVKDEEIQAGSPIIAMGQERTTVSQWVQGWGNELG